MPSINASYEDLVHGIDFTGLSSQTASEHNQLVDLATTYPTDNTQVNGVSFVLTTTDTAVNTPDVPNPATSANYAKWIRYIWTRRYEVSTGVWVPVFYVWMPTVTPDATLLNWVICDPASATTIGGALGTPLQTAINSINTDAANALAAATTANTNVALLLTACFGSNPLSVVGSSDLWDILQNIDAQVVTLSSNFQTLGLTVAGQASQIASINSTITALQAGSTLVTNLIPGTRAGMQLITSLGTSGPAAPVWSDPLSNQNLITDPAGPAANASGTVVAGTTLTTSALAINGTIYSVTLPVGWWKISAVMGGQIVAGTSDTITKMNLIATIGSATIAGASITKSNAIALAGPVTFQLLGVVLVSAAGTLTLTIKATVTGTPSFITNGTVNFVAERLSVANA